MKFGLWSNILIVVGAACIYVYLLPSPIDPKPYRFENGPPKLEGPLSINNKLHFSKRLFEGMLKGPESFTVDHATGYIYTGTSDGKIWQLQDDQTAKVWVRTGLNHSLCGTFDYEPECGRPKGMKVHPDGNLYVVDAYKGLLSVDLNSGAVETLLTEIEGVPFSFLNGLDIGPDGTIYFTDSSAKWQRRHYVYEVMEINQLGRLISYNPSTKEKRLLLSNLTLANGVAISSDGTFLIISEMSICRITKYYLKGPKAGEAEIFADNLPGYPDNIKISTRGTFYVGMATPRFEGASALGFSFLDAVSPYPSIKQFIAKITPFWAYTAVIPKHAILLEVNMEGHIVRSFQDPGGCVIGTGLSEGFEHDGHLYIGHFAMPYMAKISIQDLYS